MGRADTDDFLNLCGSPCAASSNSSFLSPNHKSDTGKAFRFPLLRLGRRREKEHQGKQVGTSYLAPRHMRSYKKKALKMIRVFFFSLTIPRFYLWAHFYDCFSSGRNPCASSHFCLGSTGPTLTILTDESHLQGPCRACDLLAQGPLGPLCHHRRLNSGLLFPEGNQQA